MTQGSNGDDAIEVRGFVFPGALDALAPDERAVFQSEGQQDGLIKAALSVVRSSDRVLLSGGGCGLIPVLLAGHLGVRNVVVTEADTERRAYLETVMTANALIRVRVTAAPPADFAPSLFLSDLSAGYPTLPESLRLENLRCALLRLPVAHADVAAVFAQMSAGGLTYFPRQSSGDVVTFLSKWH